MRGVVDHRRLPFLENLVAHDLRRDANADQHRKIDHIMTIET